MNFSVYIIHGYRSYTAEWYILLTMATHDNDMNQSQLHGMAGVRWTGDRSGVRWTGDRSGVGRDLKARSAYLATVSMPERWSSSYHHPLHHTSSSACPSCLHWDPSHHRLWICGNIIMVQSFLILTTYTLTFNFCILSPTSILTYSPCLWLSLQPSPQK